MKIKIPEGKLGDSASEKRKKLKQALINGNTVISNTGEVKDEKEVKDRDIKIKIPEGKLASFYWYERDKELFKSEKEAMNKYFPQFKIQKLDDGRMSWVGNISNVTGENSNWFLQIVYDNDHPNNRTWGGSIKIYPIKPSLEDLQEALEETIPHILKDDDGYLYMCTAQAEDVKVGNINTTAASALAWAVKWIAAFEIWLSGDLSTEEFRGHLV